MASAIPLLLPLFTVAFVVLGCTTTPVVRNAGVDPTRDVGVKPPAGAVVLFEGAQGPQAAFAELHANWVDWRDWPDGHEGDGWKTSTRNTSPAGFAVAPDPEFPGDTNRVTLRAVQRTAPPGRWGYDDIEVRPEHYHGDARIHVEWIAMGRHDEADPENPDRAEAYEPQRGAAHYVNSGVYLQNRYEVQILSNPLNVPITDPHAMGAIVNEHAPSANPGRPNGAWQAYDIEFRAARWKNGVMTEPARMSVWWNGVLVHDDRVVTGKATGLRNTSGEPVDSLPLGLKLQSETGDVRFRNVWMERR